MATNDKPGLHPAPQTDLDAANSSVPDTDRLPAWNDPDWDSYLWAVDPDYRIDWYLDHGDTEAARDEVEELRERKIEDGDWSDADEEDYLVGWSDDDDDA